MELFKGGYVANYGGFPSPTGGTLVGYVRQDGVVYKGGYLPSMSTPFPTGGTFVGYMTQNGTIYKGGRIADHGAYLIPTGGTFVGYVMKNGAVYEGGYDADGRAHYSPHGGKFVGYVEGHLDEGNLFQVGVLSLLFSLT